jgi:hypothetical protein
MTYTIIVNAARLGAGTTGIDLPFYRIDPKCWDELAWLTCTASVLPITKTI